MKWIPVDSGSRPDFDEFVWIRQNPKNTRQCPYGVARLRKIGKQSFWMLYHGNRTIWDVTHYAHIEEPEDAMQEQRVPQIENPRSTHA